MTGCYRWSVRRPAPLSREVAPDGAGLGCAWVGSMPIVMLWFWGFDGCEGVAAAALLVFVDVMKELPATLVLRPFNSDTLAVMAYQLARDERLAEAALPALAIVAVGLLPVLLLWRAMKLK